MTTTITSSTFRIAQRVPKTSGGHVAVLQQREGKPKGLSGVVAAHQAGLNVELQSPDSQRVIVRVRELIMYLSSSQVISKTTKLPKAQRVTEITTPRRNCTSRGAAGGIFFVLGVRVTMFVVAESGGPGGIGLQPWFACTLVQTASGGIGRDRAESGIIGLQRPHQTASSPVCGGENQVDLLFSDFGGVPGGWPLKVWK